MVGGGGWGGESGGHGKGWGKVPEHGIPIPPIFATFSPSSSLALSEIFLKCHCTEKSNTRERLGLGVEVQCWVPHSCAGARYWPGVAPLVAGSWGDRVRDPRWGYRTAESGTVCVFGGRGCSDSSGQKHSVNYGIISVSDNQCSYSGTCQLIISPEFRSRFQEISVPSWLYHTNKTV